MKAWSCKIGEVSPEALPFGADFPMRRAVERAYHEITGQWPEFIFSGWGAELTEDERAAVEEWPRAQPTQQRGETHDGGSGERA